FGVRELGKPEPVTPNTRFAIASLTKPLTTLMVAALVSEGKIAWETRVVDLYPSFALGDAELTKKLTVRHMLCQCTGVPYDNLGPHVDYAGVTPEKMIERMKALSPTAPLRDKFLYSNPMAAAGGYIAAHAYDPRAPLAVAYEKALRDKVLVP